MSISAKLEPLSDNNVTMAEKMHDVFNAGYQKAAAENPERQNLQEITNWQHFNFGGSRQNLVNQLKFEDTSKGTNFKSFNETANAMTNFPLIDTSNGIDFSRMFYGCSQLNNVSALNLSKCGTLDSAFYNCKALAELPILDIPKCSSLYSTFYNCENLESVSFANAKYMLGNTYQAFANCKKLKTVTGLTQCSPYDIHGMFMGCVALEIAPEIDTSGAQAISYLFSGCTALKTIPKLSLKNIQNTSYNVSNAFTNCTALENITFEGEIIVSGMTLQYSKLLSKESIISLINALSATTTGRKVTLSKTAVNNAFETSEGAADGSTSAEWLELIATKSNWTISLS